MLSIVKISKLLSDKSRNINIKNSFDYIRLSRKGLTFKQLIDILNYTKITMKELPHIISISERQLLRYKADQILRRDISDQMIQVAHLYNKGYEIFEDELHFQEWMHSEIQGLGFEQPVNLLDTSMGIQIVINELGRLEHGIVS